MKDELERKPLPKQPCKACGGQGWHKSNVSRMTIKCPRCRGTGIQWLDTKKP